MVKRKHYHGILGKMIFQVKVYVQFCFSLYHAPGDSQILVQEQYPLSGLVPGPLSPEPYVTASPSTCMTRIIYLFVYLFVYLFPSCCKLDQLIPPSLV